MVKIHPKSEIKVWSASAMNDPKYSRCNEDENKIILQAEPFNDRNCIVEVIDPKYLEDDVDDFDKITDCLNEIVQWSKIYFDGEIPSSIYNILSKYHIDHIYK